MNDIYLSVIIFIAIFVPLFFFTSLDTAISLALVFALIPYFVRKIIESYAEKEKEEQFIKFCLDLAQALQTGLPINVAMEQILKNDYGVLNDSIRRLAARIDWGIRLEEAFKLFAEELDNPLITRNVKAIIEIYKAGGDLGKSLQSVIESLIEIRRLKREREAAVYENILHAYLVFLFFLGIVIVLDVFLLPFLQSTMSMKLGGIQLGKSYINIEDVLFHLAIIQSIFSGLALGKMYTGSYKAGLKHVLFFLILTVIVFKIILPIIPKGLLIIEIPRI